jgi:hypothetical protein
MAVWQAKLNVIAVQPITGGWGNWPAFNRLCQRITSILDKDQSWHQDLERWGSDGKHQIEIWTYDDETGGFAIRIDLRQEYSDFVRDIAGLLADFGLKVEHNSKLLEPSVDSIMLLVKSSHAYQFVRNPSLFIESMRRNES